MMLFLLEEIAVEAVMIVATIVAAACLLIVLVGFVLQRRAASAPAPAVRTERAARVPSGFTPSPN
jgi:hypothetical protein